jgi:hypothetical protein
VLRGKRGTSDWSGWLDQSEDAAERWTFEVYRRTVIPTIVSTKLDYIPDYADLGHIPIGRLDGFRTLHILSYDLLRRSVEFIGSGPERPVVQYLSGEVTAFAHTGFSEDLESNLTGDRINFNTLGFQREIFAWAMRKKSSDIGYEVLGSESVSCGPTVEVIARYEGGGGASGRSMTNIHGTVSLKWDKPLSLEEAFRESHYLACLLDVLAGGNFRTGVASLFQDDDAYSSLDGISIESAPSLNEITKPAVMTLSRIDGPMLPKTIKTGLEFGARDRRAVFDLARLERRDYSEKDLMFYCAPIIDRLSKDWIRDEESSIQTERDNFFSYIDNGSPAVQEFAKKHLKVVNFKPPSLAILVDRCMDDLQIRSWGFQEHFGNILSNGRNAVMHGGNYDMEALTDLGMKAHVLALAMVYKKLGIDLSRSGLVGRMPVAVAI